jgi:hypothetical protein
MKVSSWWKCRVCESRRLDYLFYLGVLMGRISNQKYITCSFMLLNIFCKSSFLKVGDTAPVIKHSNQCHASAKDHWCLQFPSVSPCNTAFWESPNSLEEPTNIEFTAATRPRMWSWVFSWRMVWRMTTGNPHQKTISSLKQRLQTTKKIEDSPKQWCKSKPKKMAANNFIPAFLVNGI